MFQHLGKVRAVNVGQPMPKDIDFRHIVKPREECLIALDDLCSRLEGFAEVLVN